MRRNIHAILLSVLLLTLFAPSVGADESGNDDCFSIVVGKNVSADGFVIMAHNEDDGGSCVVNHYKVPRKKYAQGEMVTLLNGGQVEQVEETWAHIWSEIPDYLFSDALINEFGVAIASDACPSREDKPELTDGGISFMLRHLVGQRAKSAREGVKIAGELVERFGYDGSGRTYVISDPDEGWFFCAVNGKHWLAKRVPDSHVAIIANTYTVGEVDLADTLNYLAAPDIIDYAVARGWYDPGTDGAFDFARVYADSGAAVHPTNIGRHWAALRLLARDEISIEERLPFSVVPKKTVDVPTITAVLRDHYEGTDLFEPSQDHSFHDRTFKPICRADTRTSFVVQLRRNMPLDIGIAYWTCLGSPCASTYIPFYFGMDRFPDGWSWGTGSPTDEEYEQKLDSPLDFDSGEAYWIFSNLRRKLDGELHDVSEYVRKGSAAAERKAHQSQAEAERQLLELYRKDPAQAREQMLEHSTSLYLLALQKAKLAAGSR